MAHHDRNSILELLEPAARGDLEHFRNIARRFADEARTDGDDGFHDTVLKMLGDDEVELPPGLHPLTGTLKTLTELKLTEGIKRTVDGFLEEIRERDALAAGGVTPRHKALFMGPPGNGKTVLARAIALELGIPAYMVRYDDLITTNAASAGQTAKNLLRMFTFAAKEPCLLFFDEFDALGRERDDAQESGEMKRVVSTLLVQLDDVPSHVVCIAATNHAKMLDSAIWRRFNIRLELPKPDLEQYPDFFRREFAKLGYSDIRFGTDRLAGEIDLEILTLRMSPENFSDGELFVRNCVRSLILVNKRAGDDPSKKRTIEQVIWSELISWSTSNKKQVI